MTQKHTSGPWRVLKNADYHSGLICTIPGKPEGNYLTSLCVVGPDDIPNTTTENAEHDAALIARCPQMKEALEIALREMTEAAKIDEWAGNITPWLDDMPDGEAKSAITNWLNMVRACSQSIGTQIGFIEEALNV